MERIRDTLSFEQKHILDSNLELSLNNGNRESIYELVNKGADPTRALHSAIVKRDLELAKLCVEQGAELNIERQGETPLILATKMHQPEMVHLFLENGANPRANKSDALAYAAICGEFELLEKMVKHGGKIQLQPEYVMTMAAKHSLETLKRCEAMGGKLDYDHNALLRYATEYAGIDVMEYLIEKGQSIHTAPDGPNCLSIAAENGYLEKVEFLLTKGADPNAQTDTLNKPIINQHNEVVKALIERGADPTANNDKALYDAVFIGNTEIVTYLIAERKMPVNPETREWLKNSTHNPDCQHALQLLEKRDLHDRLEQRFNRPPQAKAKSKSKGFSLKI